MYQLVTKFFTSILDERVSFKIKTTSKTAKICQTDLCNNETKVSDLEKIQEFVSSDIAVFAFVNLGTVSNRDFVERLFNCVRDVLGLFHLRC